MKKHDMEAGWSVWQKREMDPGDEGGAGADRGLKARKHRRDESVNQI